MPNPNPDTGFQVRGAAELLASLGTGLHCRAWSTDGDGNPISGMDEICHYCGITFEEYRAGGWLSVYHPDDRAGLAANWARCLRTREPYVHHHRVRRADGVYRWFLTRANPVFVDGVVSHWLGATVDMDSFVNAQLAAMEGFQRLLALGSLTASLVFTADADGAFTTPQPDWERYTGQTFEQYAGWGRMDAIHPDYRQSMRECWRRTIDTGAEMRFRGGIWHAPSQTYRSMIARAVPIRSLDGIVIEWVGAYTDVEALIHQLSHWVVDKEPEDLPEAGESDLV